MNRSVSRILSALGWVVVLGGTTGLWSCQSSSGPGPLSGSQPVSVSITLNDSAKYPDSVSWKVRQDSGSAKMTPIAHMEFNLDFQVPAPVGSDRLWVDLWAAGLRCMEIPYTGDGQDRQRLDAQAITDPIAHRILVALDSTKSTAHAFPRTRGGVDGLVALWVFRADSAGTFFLRDSLPVGLDSNAVLDSLAALAARSGTTFRNLSGPWHQRYDSTWMSLRLARLIQAQAIGRSDSLALFPPYPVRFSHLLTVTDTVFVGGSTVPLEGSIESDSSGIALQWSIQKSGHTVTSFVMSQPSSPVPGAKTWDLRTQGQVSILATNSADTGSYTLRLTVSDGTRSISDSCHFLVRTKPRTQSLDSLLTPSQRSVNQMVWDSSIVHSTWRILGTKVTDSVSVSCPSGSALKLDDSTFRCTHALLPDGVARWFKIGFAKGSSKSWTDSVQFTRSRDLDKPEVRTVPNTRTLIGTDSLQTTCIAFDKQHLDSVYIDGHPATGEGGTYSATIHNINGTERKVSCVAVDEAGNRDTASFVVLRDTIPPKIELLGSTNPDTIWTTSSEPRIQLELTDESGVDSFYIPFNYPFPSVPVNGIAIFTPSIGMWGTATSSIRAIDHFKNATIKTFTAINIYRRSRFRTINPAFWEGPSANIQDSALLPTVLASAKLVFNVYFESRMGYSSTVCNVCRVTASEGTIAKDSNYTLTISSPAAGTSKWIHLYEIDSAGQTDTLHVEIRRLPTENGTTLPVGNFSMGCEGSVDCQSNESPMRKIELSTFHMDTAAVSLDLYDAIMGGTKIHSNGNPYLFDKAPVSVPYDSAILFCNARSIAEGRLPIYTFTVGTDGALQNIQANTSRDGYRLPTEAEWEYAYRAGSATPYPWGQDSSSGAAFTCFGSSLCAVNAKAANSFGIRLMSGNAREWVQDWFAPIYSPTDTHNPQGPSSGTERATRGADNTESQIFARSSSRRSAQPTAAHAFRCVRWP